MQKMIVLMFVLLFVVACGAGDGVDGETAVFEPVFSVSPERVDIETPVPTLTPEPDSPYDIIPDILAGATIASDALLADLAIVRNAYEALHPSLYRFVSKEQLDTSFNQLEAQFAEGEMTQGEAFVAFSILLGQIQDGHTYTNFYNQERLVQQRLFEQADKLPLLFLLREGGRMIVTHDGTADELLSPGSEILQINGVAVDEILRRLLPLVKADGANDGKRLHDLQLRGIDQYEWFDVYFPMFFPPNEDGYRLEGVNLDTNEPFAVTVAAVSPEARKQTLEVRYADLIQSPEELWRFEILDGETAVLTLGTFAVWNLSLDWEAFLEEAFQALQDEQIAHLIIDIRGNEGGLDAVSEQLVTYIVPNGEIQLLNQQSRLVYDQVPADLAPFLDTWNSSIKDMRERVTALPDGGYTLNDAFLPNQQLSFSPSPLAFGGDVYLLVGAGNSSATFGLANVLQANELVTTVGQETGGNLRGTSGGQFFFLRLPNSKLEMDIPLLATEPLDAQPNRGLTPNVIVPQTVDDVVNGVDGELTAVLSLIAEGE